MFDSRNLARKGLRSFTRRSALLACLVSILPQAAYPFDPTVGDFSKPATGVVRVLTWNTLDTFATDGPTTEAVKRIIEAINPDVISMQEISNSLGNTAQSAALIKARLESYAPFHTWYVQAGQSDGFNRNALCSRFPLSMTTQDTNPPSHVRGVTAGRVDLPDADFPADLYVMAIHFKCCGVTEPVSDYGRRQIHADAIINWMRDARTPGGNIDLPVNTPMLVVGDTNFINNGDQAPYHPARTMLDGTIFDTATYGASSHPDWDGSNAADAAPYDHNNGDPRTWSSTNPNSRLDRFYYTDSVMHVMNRFIVNTEAMTPTALATAGLLEEDTATASDHLPSVVDFAPGPDPEEPGRLLVNEFCANDIGADDRTFLEIINVGGRDINLDAPIDYWLKLSEILPSTVPATENEQSAFDLKGVVPAGGLFVIYDGDGESAGIKSVIETALPNPLHRLHLNSFYLDNSANSAFALVDSGWSQLDVTQETLVEAFGYAAPTPETTRYFRTDSGNALTITLGSSQWTSFNSGATGSDLSVSRYPVYTEANNFFGWKIGATATPGTPNVSPSAAGDWGLYE